MNRVGEMAEGDGKMDDGDGDDEGEGDSEGDGSRHRREGWAEAALRVAVAREEPLYVQAGDTRRQIAS